MLSRACNKPKKWIKQTRCNNHQLNKLMILNLMPVINTY